MAACVPRSVAGIIRGTNFTISVAGSSQALGVVHQFTLEFKRQLTRIYNLAAPDFYYIEGAPEGVLQLQQVVGPKGSPRLACDCSAKDISLNAGSTFCAPPPPTPGQPPPGNYLLKNTMPFGLKGGGKADDFLIVFELSYLFSDIV